MTISAGPRDIVIVHSSDLHVDNVFTASTHGGDGNMGVRAVMATARAVNADLVLWAGDVFEHNRLPDEIISVTAQLVAEAGMPVVMLPGNHDPILDDSGFYHGVLAEPDNFHILGAGDDVISFPTLDLEVWGRAHRSYGDMMPLESHTGARMARWHIAMAHGHYHPDPMSITPPRPAWLLGDAHIEQTGADYVALGHWNQAIKVGAGNVPAYYSGSPEYANTVNLIRFKANGDVTVEREPIRWE
jgi:DNA repair exonuclease SbcCD nuclease subunit